MYSYLARKIMDSGDRDIFRVCVPLTAGVFSAAMLSRLAAGTPEGTYLVAATTSLVIFPSAAFCRAITSKDSHCHHISRSPLLWAGMFFILGFFCHSTRIITLQTAPARAYFAGLHASLAGIIDALPFSDSENNALVKALILADRSALSRETVTSFRNAGAAHMLALSGMHLGIIYLIVKKLLFFLGNSVISRKIRSVLVVVITGLYTLLCESGESLVRAWLFILLNESGKVLERPQQGGDVLCAALTIHLVLRPESIMSVGFQLSYLAMVGIVFIWPHVRGWMKGKIWSALSLSICCQLFTAPLTLYYFGTFPKYFLITNLFAAPLMGVVMFCSISGIGISVLLPGLWSITPLPLILEIPITSMRWLLKAISELP